MYKSTWTSKKYPRKFLSIKLYKKTSVPEVVFPYGGHTPGKLNKAAHKSKRRYYIYRLEFFFSFP